MSYTVTSTSTTNADIWLVFDSTTAAYGQFTGAKPGSYGSSVDGGMGQYGHFKVVGDAGTFESYNLQLPDVADATSPTGYTSPGSANTCTVNGEGHGGSGTQHVIGQGTDLAECGVPAAILLTSNVAPGHSASATVTFGLTNKQDQQNDPNVPFTIVATQPNVRPDASW